jgi:hypothetical protein
VIVDCEALTGDGSTTTFSMAQSGSNACRILVILERLVQIPTTDYSVSGATLTFVSAPTSGAPIDLRYLE